MINFKEKMELFKKKQLELEQAKEEKPQIQYKVGDIVTCAKKEYKSFSSGTIMGITNQSITIQDNVRKELIYERDKSQIEPI